MNFESNIPEKNKNKVSEYKKSIIEYDNEKDLFSLISDVKEPKDILKYSKEDRKSVAYIYNQKLLKEKLELTETQKDVEEFIQQKFDNDELESKDVADFLKKTFKEEFIGKNITGLEAAMEMFNDNLDRIKMVKGVWEKFGKDVVFDICSNLILHEDLKGRFGVSISPYSVAFVFEKVEDFHCFISKDKEYLEDLQNRDLLGISYFKNKIPITAQLKTGDIEATINHEEQHKKFFILKIASLIKEKKEMRVIRDEILARISEQEEINPTVLYDTIITSYKYWSEDEDEYYYKVVKEAAISVFKLSKYFNLSNDDIIRLLSIEPIKNWTRLVNQLDSSNPVLRNKIENK